jgi:hypothetical protein
MEKTINGAPAIEAKPPATIGLKTQTQVVPGAYNRMYFTNADTADFMGYVEISGAVPTLFAGMVRTFAEAIEAQLKQTEMMAREAAIQHARQQAQVPPGVVDKVLGAMRGKNRR